jgi:hypothetical protein
VLPQIIGSLALVVLAILGHASFHRPPKPRQAMAWGLRIPKQKLGAGVMALLFLFQVGGPAVGIQQNFWLGLACWTAFTAIAVWLILNINGLGWPAKSGWSIVCVIAIVAYVAEPLRKQWGLDRASKTASTTDPIIEPSYNLNFEGLPIKVSPLGAIYIIKIEEDRTIDPTTFYNSETKIVSWPVNTPRDLFPPEAFGELWLANHGSVSVFNVRYSFEIFIEGNSPKDARTVVPVTMPLLDLPVGGPARVAYIVNQSSRIVMINLSHTAIGLVAGSRDPRSIELTPRDITFWDKLPTMFMTLHKWDGDTILRESTIHKKIS